MNCEATMITESVVQENRRAGSFDAKCVPDSTHKRWSRVVLAVAGALCFFGRHQSIERLLSRIKRQP